MTDEQLMMQVRNGDIAQAAVLFDRYSGRLYNFFVRLTYDQALSEDLTQSVFERIIRYRSSFNDHHQFKSWIFQIARNVRTDFYKKNKIKVADEIDVSSVRLMTSSVAEKMEHQEDLKNLEKAMLRLSAEQREILVLTRFQKLKYAQVAEMLNTSEGAVKVKVHRAIKSLRTVFLKINKA
ncbi:MAG: sigma-70 family RNA polymerase sigma factor [Bacteroidota bacterium]